MIYTLQKQRSNKVKVKTHETWRHMNDLVKFWRNEKYLQTLEYGIEYLLTWYTQSSDQCYIFCILYCFCIILTCIRNIVL